MSAKQRGHAASAHRSAHSRRPRPGSTTASVPPRSTSAAVRRCVGGQRRTIGADDEGRAVGRGERRQHARAEIAVGLARQPDAETRAQVSAKAGWRCVGRRPQRHRPGAGGAWRSRPRARSGAPATSRRRPSPSAGMSRVLAKPAIGALARIAIATGSVVRGHSRIAAPARPGRRRRNRRAAGATSAAWCGARRALPSAGRR